MNACRKLVSLYGAAGFALLALTGAGRGRRRGAQYSAPPPPVDEGRKFTYSFNLAGTSDYVFRGISQTDNDPTIQGGADLSYGIFYAGTWAFGARLWRRSQCFGLGGAGRDRLVRRHQTDVESPLGLMNLDFGAIYYTYPGANDFAGNLDYVELKAGYSWSVLHPSLTTGTTVYWSPDYFAETGSVWTIETFAAWTLPKVHVFTPVVNGLIGWQKGNAKDGYFVNVNGDDDEYYYWNAGLALVGR